LTEELLSEFSTQIGGWRLVPSSGGRHEVTINGELVFSKLATGRFPEASEIRQAVAARLK
jgi:selenoprotein W-related protein